MKKRILAMLLTLCMALTFLPATTLAEEVASGTCGDNLTWTLDGAGTLTISGTGAMSNYSIGSTDSSPWDKYKIDIKFVHIEDGVASIGDYAFKNCHYLTSVTIPDSVTSIGEGAFSQCGSLTSATIPNSVTSIERITFEYCTHLTNVTIPDSVTSIGSGAFSFCSRLTNVTIPNHVTSIGRAAFSRCTNLTNVTIPDSVTDVEAYAFSKCTALTSVNISKNITSIETGMFEDCASLTNVTIPDSVTYIGGDAFKGCTSLTDVLVPDSVTRIMNGVFCGCTGLTAIKVGANNQSYISVDGVLLEQGKYGTTIVSYLCGKQGTYTVPANVTNILPDAFTDCTGLTYFYVDPANTKYISTNGILRNKEWNTVVAYPSVNIKDGVYTVPEGISEIEYGMLNGNSSLIRVIFPEGVETIDVAFCDCENLTSIVIPSTIRSIDPYAFSGCFKLRDVYFAGTRAQWKALGIEDALGDKSTELTNATIHYNSTGPDKPADYTITFNPNGGSVSLDVMTTDTAGKLTSLPTPTRTGYTFDGWYTSASGGEKVDVNHIYTADTTLYSHWTENAAPPEPDDGELHGRVTITATFAEDDSSGTAYTICGETVTLRVYPDAGYRLSSIQVTGPDGQQVPLTQNGNSYTFAMPTFDVTVYPEFMKI